MTTLDKTLGFIGAGNMAEAMIGALTASRTLEAGRLMACDINTERLDTLKRSYHITVSSDAAEVFKASDIVVLAVKPQVMDSMLETLVRAPGYAPQSRKLVISIAAGIPLARLENILYAPLSPEERDFLPIIRVMPNTPSLVLEGMSGFCLNARADQTDSRITQAILESMGKALSCTEDQMDAVTAVSGSGPAYFFHMIEAMVAAGQELGLNADEARTLSIQTMKGAAKLLESSGESPGVLREKVTSPGGTTEAALHSLADSEFMETIAKALSAAARRSKELSS